MTDTERLTFKDMCSRFDVTARTLRYYEYIELLHPEKEGRSRFYGPREIARMSLILKGRRFGLSLEEIRQWLVMYDKEDNTAQTRAWVELANKQLGVLGKQLEELTATVEELRALRDAAVKELEGEA